LQKKIIKASSLVKVLVFQDTKVNGKCRITASPELSTFKPLKFQFGFPFGSPYAPAFAEYIFSICISITAQLSKYKSILFL